MWIWNVTQSTLGIFAIGMQYCITSSTRVTISTSSSLDNTICNLNPMEFVIGICDPLFSDHHGIYFYRANYRRALREEKFKYYDEVVTSSDNKSKTIWNIVKRELSFITFLPPQDFNVFLSTICVAITCNMPLASAIIS